VGERLKLLLEKLNLKQNQFAKSVDVSPSHVSDVLTGRRNGFSTDVIIKISELYKVNIHWFLTGEGGMFLNEVVESDMSKSTSPKKTNGHLTGIDGSVETYPGLKDVEQISRTKWFEKYSSDKKTIVAANDELLDGESLHDLAVHMMYLVKMQREKMDKLKQGSDEKPMNQKGEAG
jgi:transcriptional regulator with XRE-family HTH domain